MSMELPANTDGVLPHTTLPSPEEGDFSLLVIVGTVVGVVVFVLTIIFIGVCITLWWCKRQIGSLLSSRSSKSSLFDIEAPPSRKSKSQPSRKSKSQPSRKSKSQPSRKSKSQPLRKSKSQPVRGKSKASIHKKPKRSASESEATKWDNRKNQSKHQTKDKRKKSRAKKEHKSDKKKQHKADKGTSAEELSDQSKAKQQEKEKKPSDRSKTNKVALVSSPFFHAVLKEKMDNEIDQLNVLRKKRKNFRSNSLPIISSVNKLSRSTKRRHSLPVGRKSAKRAKPSGKTAQSKSSQKQKKAKKAGTKARSHDESENSVTGSCSASSLQSRKSNRSLDSNNSSNIPQKPKASKSISFSEPLEVVFGTSSSSLISDFSSNYSTSDADRPRDIQPSLLNDSKHNKDNDSNLRSEIAATKDLTRLFDPNSKLTSTSSLTSRDGYTNEKSQSASSLDSSDSSSPFQSDHTMGSSKDKHESLGIQSSPPQVESKHSLTLHTQAEFFDEMPTPLSHSLYTQPNASPLLDNNPMGNQILSDSTPYIQVNEPDQSPTSQVPAVQDGMLHARRPSLMSVATDIPMTDQSRSRFPQPSTVRLRTRSLQSFDTRDAKANTLYSLYRAQSNGEMPSGDANYTDASALNVRSPSYRGSLDRTLLRGIMQILREEKPVTSRSSSLSPKSSVSLSPEAFSRRKTLSGPTGEWEFSQANSALKTSSDGVLDQPSGEVMKPRTLEMVSNTDSLGYPKNEIKNPRFEYSDSRSDLMSDHTNMTDADFRLQERSSGETLKPALSELTEDMNSRRDTLGYPKSMVMKPRFSNPTPDTSPQEVFQSRGSSVLSSETSDMNSQDATWRRNAYQKGNVTKEPFSKTTPQADSETMLRSILKETASDEKSRRSQGILTRRHTLERSEGEVIGPKFPWAALGEHSQSVALRRGTAPVSADSNKELRFASGVRSHSVSSRRSIIKPPVAPSSSELALQDLISRANTLIERHRKSEAKKPHGFRSRRAQSLNIDQPHSTFQQKRQSLSQNVSLVSAANASSSYVPKTDSADTLDSRKSRSRRKSLSVKNLDITDTSGSLSRFVLTSKYPDDVSTKN